jgi:hypothetical protein
MAPASPTRSFFALVLDERDRRPPWLFASVGAPKSKVGTRVTHIVRLLELLGWRYVTLFRGVISVEHDGILKPAEKWLPASGRAIKLTNASPRKAPPIARCGRLSPDDVRRERESPRRSSSASRSSLDDGQGVAGRVPLPRQPPQVRGRDVQVGMTEVGLSHPSGWRRFPRPICSSLASELPADAIGRQSFRRTAIACGSRQKKRRCVITRPRPGGGAHLHQLEHRCRQIDVTGFVAFAYDADTSERVAVLVVKTAAEPVGRP